MMGESTKAEVTAQEPDDKPMSTRESQQPYGTEEASQRQAIEDEALNNRGAQDQPQGQRANNAGLRSKVVSYLVNLAKEPPWTTISILAVIVTVEIIAETQGQRTKLLETLALSADRWYTVTTYWAVHADCRHAWLNIICWIFTSPFAEKTSGRRQYAKICVAVTVVLGTAILISKADTLTGDRNAAGVSIIGWMATITAVGLLFRNLTGKEKVFRLGLFSSYTFLALAATSDEMLSGLHATELPAQMLGHLGGASAGFIIVASAIGKGKFRLTEQNDGKEYIATLTSGSLLLLSAGFALALV